LTCHLCTDAHADPTRDYYAGFCNSCQGRAIAVVGDRDALLADPVDAETQRMLEQLFGADRWTDGLALARHWVRRIRQVDASRATA
jgi:hypothetical protein